MNKKFFKNRSTFYAPRFTIPYNRGAALTLAVLFFVIISLAIVMGSVNPVVRDFNTGSELINSKLSYFTAEAGNEDAIYRTKKGKQLSSPEITALNGGAGAVTGTSIASNEKQIAANSTLSSLARNVQTALYTGTGFDFTYGAQAGEGGVEMDQNSRIEGVGGTPGNVYSNGPIIGSNGATITGSATVASTISEDVQARSTVCNQDQIVGQNDPQIDFAQSFIPSESKTLFKVSIYIKKVGSSNPPGTKVRIVSDNAGSPSTSSLASEDLQANLVTGSYGWVDVVFQSPTMVTAGQTYWIVLDAGENSSRYWVWCKDSNNGFGNGVGKYSEDWDDNPWTQITGDLTFKTYLGAGVGSINNVIISGNAYANTITNSTVTGTPYCQTGSGNNFATCNTSQPDPPPLNMPISQGNIDQWKADASAGGVIAGDYTVLIDVSLGPKEITGNLLMASNNKTLTVTGTVYVRGNIDISNGSAIRCDISFGSDSCIIVADGWVHIANNGTFQGSGSPGSFLLLVTTLACTGSSGTGCTHHTGAVDVHNQATGIVFYASNGMINLHNGVTLTSATAYKLRLDNTATIQYDQGIMNTNFSSGPGGGWNIKSWDEVQ